MDLTAQLSGDWKAFNDWFVPAFRQQNPGKSKITAGIACGAVWTSCKGIAVGDAVVAPIGGGQLRTAIVSGPYFYHAGGPLPHRRPVDWFGPAFNILDVSSPLKRAVDLPLAVISLSPYATELEGIVANGVIPSPAVVASGIPIATAQIPVGTDPWSFALEKHLEDFLVHNWAHTELGQEFDIYEESGELVGQQYETETGPLDILAISKDRQTLLVVELKKGRPSDAVVGQTLRYMGFVQERLAEDHQTVRGAIIALGDDPRLTWALKMVPSIRQYRYEVDFRLV